MKKHLKMLDFVFDEFYDGFKAVISQFIFTSTLFGFINVSLDGNEGF